LKKKKMDYVKIIATFLTPLGACKRAPAAEASP